MSASVNVDRVACVPCTGEDSQKRHHTYHIGSHTPPRPSVFTTLVDHLPGSMALLGFIGTRDKSAPSPLQSQTAPDARDGQPTEAPVDTPPPSADPLTTQGASPTNSPENSPQTHSPASGTPPVSKTNESEAPPPVADQSDSATRAGVAPDSHPRRFTFPGQFKRLRKPEARLSPVERPGATAPASSTDKVKKKPSAASSNADRRAKQSALVVRSLIVGQDTDQGGLVSPQGPITSTQLKNVKGQLLQPKTAGKLIAQLRALPALPNSAERASTPIQAVCLSSTDEEADSQRLSRLRNLKSLPPPPNKTTTVGSSPAAGPTIDSVTEAFKNLHVINLFQAPDLGLGQPGDGPGLLAGAVPTAETVINGLTQITPQLMALGYATGRAVIPDHNGIYPPTDRLSVLTCTPHY